MARSLDDGLSQTIVDTTCPYDKQTLLRIEGVHLKCMHAECLPRNVSQMEYAAKALELSVGSRTAEDGRFQMLVRFKQDGEANWEDNWVDAIPGSIKVPAVKN